MHDRLPSAASAAPAQAPSGAPAPVLVLAPIGHDSHAIAAVLADAGLPAAVVADMADLCRRAVADPTGALLIAAEALEAGGAPLLARTLAAQPPWSDLPVIVLTPPPPATGASGGATADDAVWRFLQQLEPIGNVSLLERPLRVATLVSAATVALRARRRQHELRVHLECRTRAEGALQRHRDSLETLIQERSRELEQSQEALRQSERLAALGTLARGLGHDLNNMLMPLRAHAEALSQEPGLSDAARADVGAIRGLAEYLAGLTRGLRLFARDPDAADDDVSTDLADWLEGLTPLLRSMLPARIALLRTLAPDLPRVRLAPHQLSQIAVNLVQNAGDAIASRGQEAGGTVAISASPGEDGSGLVELAFEDDGPGMSEDVRRRCMEPFFTTKARGRGTGLGLAIVHGRVAAAGGEVTIDSAPGRGATIRLRLPCAPPSAPAFTGAQTNGAAPHPCAPPRLTAAVTVQDPRAAALARAILEASGLIVIHPAPGASPDGATVWITDDANAHPDQIRAFLGAAPTTRRVVALTAPSSPAATHFASTGARLVGRDAGLAAVRAAVRDAAMLLPRTHEPEPHARAAVSSDCGRSAASRPGE